MKRISMLKIVQHNQICYVGKIDPRDLVRVADEIEIGQTQDAQRPLSGKRIKDIAKYVADNGILPNTLTLAVNDNSFPVCDEGNGLFSIQFPTTEEEFSRFKNKIFVMDGQHRLYAFREDIRSISNNENFELGFTLYDKPTLVQKQNIFMVCNEKQEKVSGNLLMWFKNQLNMLTEEDKTVFNLVEKLNHNYPLKGRIILGGEKIKNGLKAKEIMLIVTKSKIRKLAIKGVSLRDDQLIKILTDYLSGWERAINFNFNLPNKTTGAATKISGLRFMLFALPGFWERSIRTREHFDQDFVIKVIKELASDIGVVPEEFFTDSQNKIFFQEMRSTEKFAEECALKIKDRNEEFDPLS